MAKLNVAGKSGRFVAFEGGEGAGKSTQVKLLARALEAVGITVDVTREPGGTSGAEAIRNLLLSPPNGASWGARAEALLFAAARSDHVEQRIVPALERGEWVLCDRFLDSSRAYQGGASGLGDDTILRLHQIGSEGILPDVTLLLEVDPESAAERLAKRDGGENDAIGGRSAEYHAAVGDTFRALAHADTDRFAIIDGNGSADEVHAQVWQAIQRFLP
ncbi:MAG: dTMP kinase [Pseudomonadota bacterium]|nr:dTMP kinase [Pseudomonadota bacterium]